MRHKSLPFRIARYLQSFGSMRWENRNPASMQLKVGSHSDIRLCALYRYRSRFVPSHTSSTPAQQHSWRAFSRREGDLTRPLKYKPLHKCAD